MSTRRRSTLVLVLPLLVALMPAPGATTEGAAGLEENGQLFVTAWLSLRRDLDTLTSTKLHPTVANDLVANLPAFLAADFARLTADPFLYVAAMRRWFELEPGAAARHLLRSEDENPLKSNPLLHDALCARFGDRPRTTKLVDQLGSKNYLLSVPAATALAMADHPAGLPHLRRVARSDRRGYIPAIRQLGRFGQNQDRKLLEELARKHPTELAARASLGEFHLRRTMPTLHRILDEQDPAERRRGVDGGLYDTWFTALGAALELGNTELREVRSNLKAQRRPPAGTLMDRELWRRQIKLLVEILDANRPILVRSSRPVSFPTSVDQAAGLLKKYRTNSPSAEQLARRMAAAIYICTATGNALEHSKILKNSNRVNVISAGGTRASDGNLATAFHVAEGERFVFEVDRPVQRIWLASVCPYNSGSWATEVTLELGPPHANPKQTHALLPDFPYLQSIPIQGKPNGRISIVVSAVTGTQPACFAEVRVEPVLPAN